MLESSFQRAMAREFTHAGWTPKHLSPPSERGFPDHLVTRWDRYFYVEYKEVETFDSQKLLGSIMEDAQLPWALNHLKSGGLPVYLAIHSTGMCGFLPLLEGVQIITLKQKRIKDVSFHFEATAGELALSILRDADQRSHVPCRRQELSPR